LLVSFISFEGTRPKVCEFPAERSSSFIQLTPQSVHTTSTTSCSVLSRLHYTYFHPNCFKHTVDCLAPMCVASRYYSEPSSQPKRFRPSPGGVHQQYNLFN
jgi:hypothetical protein